MIRVYRPARPARARRHLAAGAVQSAVLSLVLLGLVPAAISWAEARWSPVRPTGRLGRATIGAGAAVLAGATGLNVGSAATMAVHGDGTPLPMDAARHLVVRGPYRWARNPMAIGGIAQGIGVGLLRRSGGTILFALCGAVLWHVAIRPSEEADLLRRHGEPYARYREAVRCWWPRRRPVPAP
ncbi:methyltransferase family protein [Brachybacterium sp. AOP25-B2-12]|uniref:methyltransferase family protein n=1 Tax=Brachybacterium sp. AOP25-B2-12 TaxID=3457710 RepID=UPI0040337816